MSALSPAARHEYYAELGNALPPPVNPTPEYRQRRITTAIEAFEALHPGDAYEARLAVDIVLSGAHAADSLREAGLFCEDYAKRTRCRAQAASLMREERTHKRMLAQEQKVRLAAEAVAGTPSAHPATASAPQPQAEPKAAPQPVQAPAETPQSAPVAAPVPPAVAPLRPAATLAAPQPVQAAPPSPEAIAEAEAFAEEEGMAAAQIRHDRGVTPQNKAYLRHLTLPTDPAVIDALVRGTTDLLTLLDEVGGEDLDAAA
jgi:hypothetical protein